MLRSKGRMPTPLRLRGREVPRTLPEGVE